MWIQTTAEDGDSVSVTGGRGSYGLAVMTATDAGHSGLSVNLDDEQAADLLASLLSMGVRLIERSQRLLADYGVVSI